MNTSLHVLLSCLDWGNGHLTRSLPIIKALKEKGATIYFAGNAFQINFMKQEGIEAKYFELGGYNVVYAKNKLSFYAKILQQIPKIQSAIKHEKQFIEKLLKTNHIDVIISDNRYGFRSPRVPSIFIGHQINIQAAWLSGIVNYVNRCYLKLFSAVWIPDTAQTQNLSGALSHPTSLENIVYIGPLTRFKKLDSSKSKNSVLLILSGPEPQKSLLHDFVLHQLSQQNTYTIGVAGTCEAKIIQSPVIQYFGFCNSQKINELANTASCIITRSGYSSIMDLACIQAKAILIPTPAQTEQIYLAKYLNKKYNFLSVSQSDANLLQALDVLLQAEPENTPFSFNTFHRVLDNLWTSALKQL